MRCFTVNENGIEEGILITKEPFPHVAVGEAGRGRILARISIYAPGAKGDRLYNASLMQIPPLKIFGKPENEAEAPPNYALKAEDDNASVNILALIDVAAGYRGYTSWRLPDDEKYHPKIIAEGYKAQGEAGRMGGHRVALAILPPESGVMIARSGRLYGEPEEVFIWLSKGGELKVGTEQEVFPSIPAQAGGAPA